MDLISHHDHASAMPHAYRKTTPPPSPSKTQKEVTSRDSAPAEPTAFFSNVVLQDTQAIPAHSFEFGSYHQHPLMQTVPAPNFQQHPGVMHSPFVSNSRFHSNASSGVFFPEGNPSASGSPDSTFNELAFLTEYQQFQQEQQQHYPSTFSSMSVALHHQYQQHSLHPDQEALSTLSQLSAFSANTFPQDYLFQSAMCPPVGIVTPAHNQVFLGGSEYLEHSAPAAFMHSNTLFNSTALMDFVTCASPSSFHSKSASPIPLLGTSNVTMADITVVPSQPAVQISSPLCSQNASVETLVAPSDVLPDVKQEPSPEQTKPASRCSSVKPRSRQPASRAPSVRQSPFPGRRAATKVPVSYNEADSDDFSERSSASPVQRSDSGSWSQGEEDKRASGRRSSASCGTRCSVAAVSSNYHKWSPEEDEILRSAILRVTKNNVADVAGKWVRISQLVPGRTPIQCSARWTGALNSDIVRGKWTAREDKLLVTAVAEERARVERVDASGTTRVSDADLNWQRIACCVAGRTGVQCAARYQEALDPDIRKGKWLSEEDALLRQGILAHGKSWVKIAAAIPNRTQRQCRTRWLQIFPKLKDEEKAELETLAGTNIAVNEKIKKKKAKQ